MTEVAACCDLDFSTVARHLSLMARSGLLSADKKGRTVWYSADGAQLAGYFRDIAEAIEDVQPGGCCDVNGSKAGCQSKSKGCA